MSADNASEVHLVIPTHTTRHLELCLISIARQKIPPATITVTADVVEPALEALLKESAEKLHLRIAYVRRQTEGKERLAQVRNNAVRFLISQGIKQGRLLFLDGDTYAEPDCSALHAKLGAHAALVLPARINLNESETAALDSRKLLAGTQQIKPTPAQLTALNRLQRRAEFHQFIRRFKLTKSHKPKLLGGHHSVTCAAFIAVNGHDEEYHTWGTEDDDFARRIYQNSEKAVIAANKIIVFHLYHPTRSRTDWHHRPNAKRFANNRLPTQCRFGLDNPWPQAQVQTSVFGPESTTEGIF